MTKKVTPYLGTKITPVGNDYKGELGPPRATPLHDSQHLHTSLFSQRNARTYGRCARSPR